MKHIKSIEELLLFFAPNHMLDIKGLTYRILFTPYRRNCFLPQFMQEGN